VTDIKENCDENNTDPDDLGYLKHAKGQKRR